MIVSGIERVVLLPTGEIEHGAAVQFECRDLVRDYFFGSGQGLTDGSPHLFENAANGFGLRRNILVYGFEVGFGHLDSDARVSQASFETSCRRSLRQLVYGRSTVRFDRARADKDFRAVGTDANSWLPNNGRIFRSPWLASDRLRNPGNPGPRDQDAVVSALTMTTD